MSRFFKYKSLAELLAENHRIGLDLRGSDDFRPLFRPLPVGPFTVGNRLCVQPMEGCDATPDGRPDELTLRRYRRFGAGGAKLIWAEAAAVVEEGRANTRQIWLNDKNMPGVAALLDECVQAHRETFGRTDDLLVGLQLTHSGRYSHQRPVRVSADPLLDARTVLDKATGRKATPADPLLSDDDLARLVEAFARAAKRARTIGFHFIDIKQCHKYLLSELLGARSRRAGMAAVTKTAPASSAR